MSDDDFIPPDSGSNIPDPYQMQMALSAGDAAILDLVWRYLIKQGRIDPDYTGVGQPKVIWDEASGILSDVVYPYISTYFPKPNDVIEALPLRSSRLILGPVGQPDAGPPNPDATVGVYGSYLATSVTSRTVPVVFPTDLQFDTQSGLSYVQGLRARAYSRLSAAYVEGLVKTYNSTSLIITVDRSIGAGAHDDWNIGLVGDPGTAGRGITTAAVDGAGNLNITFTDATVTNVGHVKGNDGANGANGISVTGASIDGSGNLILTLSTGGTINAGHVTGTPGTNGSRVIFGNPNPNTTPPGGGPFDVGTVYMRTNGGQHVFTYNGASWDDTGFTP